MAELTITLPPASAPPAANATPGAAADAGKAADASGGDNSFAATLKARMDKPADARSEPKTPSKDTTQATAADASAPATPVTEAVPATNPAPDIAALLPLLAAAGAATAQKPAGATAMESLAERPAADHRDDGAANGATDALAALMAAAPATHGPVNDTPRAETGRAAPATARDLLSQARGDGTLAAGKEIAEAAISADRPLPSGADAGRELTPLGDFRAQLERAVAAPAAPAPAVDTARLNVGTPVGRAGWQDDVGQKLTWMVGNDRHQAELVLTPPHLGRVEVSLTLHGDQAQAVFTSLNPQVREALEDSLPRLREILADAGVTLGQAQVGSESPHQSSNPGENSGSSRFGRSEGERYADDASAGAAGLLATAQPRSGRGMVDVFA